MSEPRLTSFAAGLTFAMPLSIQRPGIGLPESQADTNRRPRAVFLCAQHGQPVMGGPCGGIERCAGSFVRPANLHSSVTPSWRMGWRHIDRSQRSHHG